MMQDWIHLLRSTIEQVSNLSYSFLDNSGLDPSLRLYRLLTFTFEQCWLNSSGPVPNSLTGQCCKVATSELSRRIEPSLSQGNYGEVLQITVDCLSGLSLRYKYILLPFLNIHLVFKIHGVSTVQNTKHLGNQVLPNVLAFLLRNHALCEVCMSEESGDSNYYRPKRWCIRGSLLHSQMVTWTWHPSAQLRQNH